MAVCIDLNLPFDSCLTVWSERNDLDRNFQVVLHEADILLESLRKILFLAAACQILIPSLEFGIYRGDLALGIEWELIGLLTVNDIRCADLDGLERIEAVGLHHDEVGNAVDHHSIFEGYEVKPAASAWTTCNSAEFVSDLADLLTCLIEKLGRERTAADTGTIGFENAIYMADS